MKSILEALANNQLRVYADDIERTPEFLELKEQLDARVEKWLKKVGEEKRPLFDKMLSADWESDEILEKDSFKYGFRFGVLATIEVYINQELLIASNEDTDPETKCWSDVILNVFADEQINTDNPDRWETPKMRILRNEFDEAINEIVAGMENETHERTELIDDIYDVRVDMLKMKKDRRYICGYSLGVLIIAEVFQDRRKIIYPVEQE